MNTTVRHNAAVRFCAGLMAFFCLFFGTFASFLHTDEMSFLAAVNASPTHFASNQNSRSASQGSQVREDNAQPSHAHHCAVCEWQMNILSPALPNLTVVPPSYRMMQVVTTLPRAPQTVAVLSSSRAPPAL
jgi:hypothetical protein